MKLIFIYGPPAVGKTTVGGKLAELTGYRFFFNHLTVPAAKAIFPDAENLNEVPGYRLLLQQLRIDAITAAADADIDTIFTVAYSGVIDDSFVDQIVDTVTSRNGRVHFVQLTASRDILMERVTSQSRKDLRLGKMTSPDHLRQVLDARDMFMSVKYPGVLRLNTSELEPDIAAKQITEHCKLLS